MTRLSWCLEEQMDSYKKRRQGCFTIHPSSQIIQAVKSKGFSQLRGTEDNSRALLQDGRVKIVTQAFSLTNLKQESLMELRKSTRDDGNYTGYTHRSNTKRHIMDCQLGNPCEIVCNPRATIHSPMIEEMEGTD
ncbi:hypothetical protein Tco_1171129 [Tanacetum coccineum]